MFHCFLLTKGLLSRKMKLSGQILLQDRDREIRLGFEPKTWRTLPELCHLFLWLMQLSSDNNYDVPLLAETGYQFRHPLQRSTMLTFCWLIVCCSNKYFNGASNNRVTSVSNGTRCDTIDDRHSSLYGNIIYILWGDDCLKSYEVKKCHIIKDEIELFVSLFKTVYA